MLGIFVKGAWYSTFITAKYEYSTQNSFSVKAKFAGKCGQSPRSKLAVMLSLSISLHSDYMIKHSIIALLTAK